jgi:HAD superfamily hydrolase (TIGR01549 family)
MGSMIKAFLFDADNTLYESKQAAKPADLAVMEHLSQICGINKEELFEEWRAIVNELKTSKDPKLRHRKYSYSILLKRHKISKNVDEIYEIFLDEFLKNIRIFEGVKETLEELKKRNFKLIIVSEDFKEQLEKKIKFLGLEKFFDFFVTCDDVGSMKPDRKYYEIVRSKLKIPFDEMVAVGDSFERDLEIPKILGMRCILVFGEDLRADFSINNFKEILNILETLTFKQ